MYFKLDLTLQGIHLDKDLIEIDYGGAHKINVILRSLTEGERAISHKKGNAYCRVAGEWTPKDNLLAVFKSLANNKIPEGSKGDWEIFLDIEGNIDRETHIPMELLPDPLASFLEQVDLELNDYARRTVNVLRWRCGTEGHHDLIGSRDSHWSFDGQKWLLTPGSSRGSFWPVPHLRPSDECIDEVKRYVEEGCNQPLGYELFVRSLGTKISKSTKCPNYWYCCC